MMNGAQFQPPNKAFEEMVLAVASGRLDKEGVTQFFKRHVTI
jgi:prophage maintenance system killer protein